MLETVRNYKSFIIHLQRAKGRKEQVRDLAGKLPYKAQIVDAVDGAQLPRDDVKACFSEIPLMQPGYPFKLNVGEMGCFLSHRKVWQEIVDQRLAAGLIFEDDAHIDPDAFARSLSLASQHVETLGYIQFQTRDIGDVSKVLVEDDGVQIVQPVVTPLRTSAQLVSFNTAQNLLKLTEKFDRPIDGVLQLYWETGLHIACVVPSGVSDRTQATGGSTLSKKRPLITKLGREFKRACYKAQIRKYSKRTAGKMN